MSSSTRLVKFVDNMLERLHDGNSKVNIHALETVLSILPIIKDRIEPVISNLVPVLANNLATNNSSAKNLTLDIFDSLIKFSEGRTAYKLLELLSNSVAYGTNAKVKPFIVEKIIRT